MGEAEEAGRRNAVFKQSAAELKATKAELKATKASVKAENRLAEARIKEALAGFGKTPAPAAVESAASDKPVLRPGVRVRLHSLVAKPELNGKLARIHAFVEETGRWLVFMETGAACDRANFKPDNLTALSASEQATKSKPRARAREVSLDTALVDANGSGKKQRRNGQAPPLPQPSELPPPSESGQMSKSEAEELQEGSERGCEEGELEEREEEVQEDEDEELDLID